MQEACEKKLHKKTKFTNKKSMNLFQKILKVTPKSVSLQRKVAPKSVYFCRKVTQKSVNIIYKQLCFSEK